MVWSGGRGLVRGEVWSGPRGRRERTGLDDVAPRHGTDEARLVAKQPARLSIPSPGSRRNLGSRTAPVPVAPATPQVPGLSLPTSLPLAVPRVGARNQANGLPQRA